MLLPFLGNRERFFALPMKNTYVEDKFIAQVVSAVQSTAVRKATKFVSEQFIVRATRRFKPDGRTSRVEFILTLGRPNYREQKFIRECVSSGEPFPVKKVQLAVYP